jgi:23S rRNA (cytidine1920-2'-O)/16S rRNA (cytidine1409-2'-O)-methyltransferase
MSLTKKVRLDHLVQEQFPQYSRRQIQSWIMQGCVRVDGVPVTKAGVLVPPNALLTCAVEQPKYVSRGGFKLEKALAEFSIPVMGSVCLDAGISTGGFADCLLQHGASKVFGVDVGYGQVHEKIRHDARVTLLEKTNIRMLKMQDLGTPVDLVTLDLSFISVLKVMDAVTSCMKPNAHLVILIKPQFEAKRSVISKGGIVKDPLVHQAVIEQVRSGMQIYGFTCVGVIESPITGATGNKEFLAYFRGTV